MKPILKTGFPVSELQKGVFFGGDFFVMTHRESACAAG